MVQITKHLYYFCWVVICILLSLFNMNFFKLSSQERVISLLFVMFCGNILWALSLQQNSDQKNITKVLFWNITYLVISLLIPIILLNKELTWNLYLGLALVVFGIGLIVKK